MEAVQRQNALSVVTLPVRNGKDGLPITVYKDWQIGAAITAGYAPVGMARPILLIVVMITIGVKMNGEPETAVVPALIISTVDIRWAEENAIMFMPSRLLPAP